MYISQNAAQEGEQNVVLLRELDGKGEQRLYQDLLEFIIDFVHIGGNLLQQGINA